MHITKYVVDQQTGGYGGLNMKPWSSGSEGADAVLLGKCPGLVLSLPHWRAFDLLLPAKPRITDSQEQGNGAGKQGVEKAGWRNSISEDTQVAFCTVQWSTVTSFQYSWWQILYEIEFWAKRIQEFFGTSIQGLSVSSHFGTGLKRHEGENWWSRKTWRKPNWGSRRREGPLWGSFRGKVSVYMLGFTAQWRGAQSHARVVRARLCFPDSTSRHPNPRWFLCIHPHDHPQWSTLSTLDLEKLRAMLASCPKSNSWRKAAGCGAPQRWLDSLPEKEPSSQGTRPSIPAGSSLPALLTTESSATSRS